MWVGGCYVMGTWIKDAYVGHLRSLCGCCVASSNVIGREACCQGRIINLGYLFWKGKKSYGLPGFATF